MQNENEDHIQTTHHLILTLHSSLLSYPSPQQHSHLRAELEQHRILYEQTAADKEQVNREDNKGNRQKKITLSTYMYPHVDSLCFSFCCC